MLDCLYSEVQEIRNVPIVDSMDRILTIVVAVLLCTLWAGAVMAGRAVPLCMPDVESNEILRLSDGGLGVLRSIGDDPVVIIAIAGPARTGKSYFLSKLSSTTSFKVGHGLEAQTTGLWISTDKVLLERNNVMARLVLIDAEGIGSITRDKGSINRWDTSVVSLCTMLSSVLIYNSNKIPSYSDLEKLHFFSMFSKTGSHAQDEEATETLVWLIRDNTIDLARAGYDDWTSFFEDQVFRDTENEARDDILSGIRAVFPNFRAIALPPPSVDSGVCMELDDASHKDELSPFHDALNSAVEDIVSLAQVKRISGKPMTGKEFADLIEMWVNELNEKGGKFTWGSMYEMKMKYVCTTRLKECREQVKYAIDSIVLRCNDENIVRKVNDMKKNTIAHLRSICEQAEHLDKLESFINEEKSDLLDEWGKVQYDCLLEYFDYEISYIDLNDMNTDCETVINDIDDIIQDIQKKIDGVTSPEVENRIDIEGVTSKMEERKQRIVNKWFVIHVRYFGYEWRLRSRIDLGVKIDRQIADGYIREIEREELSHFQTGGYKFRELKGHISRIQRDMTRCRYELLDEWMKIHERSALGSIATKTALGAIGGGIVGFFTGGPVGAYYGAASGAGLTGTVTALFSGED